VRISGRFKASNDDDDDDDTRSMSAMDVGLFDDDADDADDAEGSKTECDHVEADVDDRDILTFRDVVE
jgi:hypothetical protein